MSLPPSPLSRFLGFVRRIAPFLLVWLVIAVLPASREPLQLQFWGSQLTPQLNPPWREDAPPDQKFDAFAAVARNPSDLNARVWRFSQMLAGRSGGFDASGEPNRQTYRPGELGREARAIRDAFPDQKWLGVLPIRAVRAQLATWSGTDKRITAQQAQQLAEVMQEAEHLEPGNALYPLLEADLWRRSRDLSTMWAALDRAAAAKFLDPHDLEWTRALVQAHDAARPLILEEKDALWRQNEDSGLIENTDWPQFLGSQARRAQDYGDHRRALEIAVLLGNIGDLMQRGHNTRAMASRGQEWKNQTQILLYRVWPPKPGPKPQMWALSLGAYGQAHGRPEIALLARKWQARRSQLVKFGVNAPNGAYVPPPPRNDAYAQAEKWRIAGVVVVTHLLFVAAGWLLVNGILWRGMGAPSSRLERTVPAVAMVAFSVGLSLWSWRQFEILDAARWTPAQGRFMAAVATVATLAFVGPPFLLAMWAAAATLWTRRSEFLKPARIETELRLSPGQVIILRSGPTIVCTAALVFTFGFWALYLSLMALGVTSFDLLAWLPDDGKTTPLSFPIPTEALFAPIIYLLLCDLVAFLLWFNKWRYYAGKESRPLTHGGLRAWKEMLGVYLVVASVVLLGVSLAGWPHRAQAARDIETRMVRGELPP